MGIHASSNKIPQQVIEVRHSHAAHVVAPPKLVPYGTLAIEVMNVPSTGHL